MIIWTLALKELRLLARDPRSLLVLLAMPLLLMTVLGMILGEGFGQKPDDRLRISIVNLDRGVTGQAEPWSQVVLRDLAQTGGIRVEIIPSREEAERLIQNRKRAAILVFGPDFSERVQRCSFLSDGINPFYRDGVRTSTLDAKLLIDDTQKTAAAIMEQVIQVSLLRVVLPWMVGRAFDTIGEEKFIVTMSRRIQLPLGLGNLGTYLEKSPELKAAVGKGVQTSLSEQFPNYNLTGKTWVSLTRSEPSTEPGAEPIQYRDEGGAGMLQRGALLYQTLVPAGTVAFAFFLVLTVGWLFTAERRQGTLVRLRAAPVTRTQLLLGKLVPCLFLSWVQGLLLLLAGKIVFGMSWGVDPLWLLPVVATTSLAAMGLALLVASLARTETQVATYGTLLVLVLALLGGCLVPPALMPEEMRDFSLLTPHAWALKAYNELLLSATPSLGTVALACAALTGFGVLFLGMAWALVRLD
jgi:ABC-type Na+ efflux pump permease subunit